MTYKNSMTIKTSNIGLEQTIAVLRNNFRDKNVWIVGHKGDISKTLADLEIINPTVDLAHVYSHLGVDADEILDPPIYGEVTYASQLTSIHPVINEKIDDIVNSGKELVILMPFPNKGIEDAIRKAGASQNVSLTSSLGYHDFMQLENKVKFGTIIASALPDDYSIHIIPSTLIDPGMKYSTLIGNLGVFSDEPLVYVQKALSGGGDGTRIVSSFRDYLGLLNDKEWRNEIKIGNVKASLGLKNVYPANGSACIVPTADGKCKIFIDPLSHKPMGIEEFGMNPFASFGNDWTNSFSDEIIDQYIAVVTKIGEELFFRYGYTGMFGPDGLIELDESLTPKTLKINEINARFQGTTAYQTMNALLNDRNPNELIHYLVKLNPKNIGMINEIVGNPDNESSARETGGFYIKIGSPLEKTEVINDLNGTWIYNKTSGELVPHTIKMSCRDVYCHNNEPDSPLLYVKAPKVGEIIGGELDPIGYVCGNGFAIFDENQPIVNEDAISLFLKFQDQMLYNSSKQMSRGMPTS